MLRNSFARAAILGEMPKTYKRDKNCISRNAKITNKKVEISCRFCYNEFIFLLALGFIRHTAGEQQFMFWKTYGEGKWEKVK